MHQHIHRNFDVASDNKSDSSKCGFLTCVRDGKCKFLAYKLSEPLLSREMSRSSVSAKEGCACEEKVRELFLSREMSHSKVKGTVIDGVMNVFCASHF